VNQSFDNVLVGWYWGAGPLGLYSRAYNLLMLPVRQVSAPASRVAVPTLSRIKDDPERFARYYLRAANLIMWISTPVFGFLFVSAQPVIILALGRKWLEAAPVFQILALCGVGQLLLESLVWLFVSMGQAQRLLRLLLFISPIIIGSFAVGLPFGIKGVALSGSLTLLALLPWIFRFAFKGTNLTLERLGLAIFYPISLCLAGVMSAELARHMIATQQTLSQLLVGGLGFAAAYLLSATIPQIRKEAMSLRKLFSELRISNQPA